MTVDEKTEVLARELCFLLHKDNDAEWECYIELATYVQKLLVEEKKKSYNNGFKDCMNDRGTFEG